MKKLLTGVLAAALLCGAGSAYAMDTYPVYVDGDEIGRAEAWGGQTFLPMRAIFEACGAEVNWIRDGQKIIAYAANGDCVDMQIGRYSVVVTDGQTEWQMGIENAPYARDGRVYVPVRAVAEVLKCDVDWDSAKKSVNIASVAKQGLEGCDLTFNPYLGQIYQGDKMLAEVEQVVSSASGYFYGGTGQVTANGNYLVDLGYIIQGALTSTANQYVWINPQSGEYVELFERPFWYEGAKPLVVGDKIWLTAANTAVLIDDKAGNVLKEYDLHKYIDEESTEDVVLAWANDDVALLHTRNNAWWGLLDLTTDKVEDITAKVLTDELKATVNEEFWPYVEWPTWQETYATKEEYLVRYWNDLGRTWGSVDPYLVLAFTGEKDGNLNFELNMVAWNENADGNIEFGTVDTVEFGCAYK